mgnify:CR=1 FL=1
MKIIRIKNNLTVILEDGVALTNSSCTDELYRKVVASQSDEGAVRMLLMPEYAKNKEEIERKIDMVDNMSESEYLSVINNGIYIKSISDLTLPEDLATAIWEAEKSGDVDLLTTYLNFWTLTCLNPDAAARTNLFWFLNRYGMTISRSGLFVAYRNVVLKHEGTELDGAWTKFITDSFTKVRHRLLKQPKDFYLGEDEFGDKVCTADEDELESVKGNLAELYNSLSDEKTAPVYTDGYTKTFTIRIGEAITMPREDCDTNHNNTCSRGLHVAGKSWLTSNYFGDTGLRVLVNPSDVVAVPPQDNYGKMRVCAYYPVAVVEFENGSIVDEPIANGFEDNFMDMICYVGEMSSNDTNNYKLNIPSIPEISRVKIIERFDDIKETLRIKQMENEN